MSFLRNALTGLALFSILGRMAMVSADNRRKFRLMTPTQNERVF
jgi:hypothetical protein